MAQIAKEGKGVVVIVGQEPSQEEALEQIKHFPNVPPVQRHNSEVGVYRVIGAGSQILRDVGVGKMRLLSAPTKFNAISGFNLEVVEFIDNN